MSAGSSQIGLFDVNDPSIPSPSEALGLFITKIKTALSTVNFLNNSDNTIDPGLCSKICDLFRNKIYKIGFKVVANGIDWIVATFTYLEGNKDWTPGGRLCRGITLKIDYNDANNVDVSFISGILPRTPECPDPVTHGMTQESSCKDALPDVFKQIFAWSLNNDTLETNIITDSINNHVYVTPKIDGYCFRITYMSRDLLKNLLWPDNISVGDVFVSTNYIQAVIYNKWQGDIVPVIGSKTTLFASENKIRQCTTAMTDKVFDSDTTDISIIIDIALDWMANLSYTSINNIDTLVFEYLPPTRGIDYHLSTCANNNFHGIYFIGMNYYGVYTPFFTEEARNWYRSCHDSNIKTPGYGIVRLDDIPQFKKNFIDVIEGTKSVSEFKSMYSLVNYPSLVSNPEGWMVHFKVNGHWDSYKDKVPFYYYSRIYMRDTLRNGSFAASYFSDLSDDEINHICQYYPDLNVIRRAYQMINDFYISSYWVDYERAGAMAINTGDMSEAIDQLNTLISSDDFPLITKDFTKLLLNKKINYSNKEAIYLTLSQILTKKYKTRIRYIEPNASEINDICNSLPSGTIQIVYDKGLTDNPGPYLMGLDTSNPLTVLPIRDDMAEYVLSRVEDGHHILITTGRPYGSPAVSTIHDKLIEIGLDESNFTVIGRPESWTSRGFKERVSSYTDISEVHFSRTDVVKKIKKLGRDDLLIYKITDGVITLCE